MKEIKTKQYKQAQESLSNEAYEKYMRKMYKKEEERRGPEYEKQQRERQKEQDRKNLQQQMGTLTGREATPTDATLNDADAWEQGLAYLNKMESNLPDLQKQMDQVIALQKTRVLQLLPSTVPWYQG